MKKNLSIKQKFIFVMVLVFFIMVVIVSITTGTFIYKSTISTLKTVMSEDISRSSENITKQIYSYKTLLSELALSPVLTENTSDEEKLKFINEKSAYYRNEYGGDIFYSGKDAVVLGLNISISDREFFQKAITGQATLTEPIVRKDTNTLGYTYAVPVKKDGEINGIIYMIIDFSMLNNIVSSVKVGENGYAYVLNKNGDTIIYSDEQKVINRYNSQKEAAFDSSLKSLANVEKEICSSTTGFENYQKDGKKSFLSYQSIKDTDDWKLVIHGNYKDFTASVSGYSIINILCIICIAIIAILIFLKLIYNITNPLQKISKRIESLQNGDISSEFPVITAKDEIGIMAKSIQSMTETLILIIKDTTNLLNKMENGNFSSHTNIAEKYIGDFKEFKLSIENLNHKLNETLFNMNQSIHEVAAGSEEVAESAQNLAAGTARQSEAVTKLQTNMTEITDLINLSAQNGKAAYLDILHYEQEAQASNQEMQNMTQAMERISQTSMQIGNIIKEIEDIAFQTNLLSLNAATEAARAGQAGRGFAVVADQVRKLAEDSGKSAIHTRQLIETAILEVGNGTQIAQKTSSSLKTVIEGISSLASSAKKASDLADSQNQAMHQISEEIEQISEVVQNNSIAAEHSSSTSEELSAQADNLKNQISQFKLINK